jgi:hypothetical protein
MKQQIVNFDLISSRDEVIPFRLSSLFFPDKIITVHRCHFLLYCLCFYIKEIVGSTSWRKVINNEHNPVLEKTERIKSFKMQWLNYCLWMQKKTYALWDIPASQKAWGQKRSSFIIFPDIKLRCKCNANKCSGWLLTKGHNLFGRHKQLISHWRKRGQSVFGLNGKHGN